MDKVGWHRNLVIDIAEEVANKRGIGDSPLLYNNSDIRRFLGGRPEQIALQLESYLDELVYIRVSEMVFTALKNEFKD